MVACLTDCEKKYYYMSDNIKGQIFKNTCPVTPQNKRAIQL